MTSPVSGSTSGTSALTSTTPATTTVERPDQMDKDTFLKLLVAQLRYQDPSQPADTNQMMSQSAAFSQVEALQSLAKQSTQMLALQRATSAGALVGRTVTYTDTDGAVRSGAVTSVLLGDDTTEATAVIDGKTVAVGRITAITQPAVSAQPASSTSSSTSFSTSTSTSTPTAPPTPATAS